MLSLLARYVFACWRPAPQYALMNSDTLDGDDIGDDSSGAGEWFLWCRDLERHSFGDFSFAVVQANEVIEDHSQVETGNDAVFVGVYDGHGGPEASRFISDHLFAHLLKIARESGEITEETLREAIAATEEGFMKVVKRACEIKPTIAAVGSCCLVGVIWKGTLYIANVGDSRAVVGSLDMSGKRVAEQLTDDHNVGLEQVRHELRAMHPHDSHILVLRQGVWRIKGIIQVSRSIGDAYLKHPEFSLDHSFPRFHLPDGIQRPVLSAKPSISGRVLRPNDKFVIFASDGLWEHLTNQQAVEIVFNHPRPGIARKLARTALNIAARKKDIKYNDLKTLEIGRRRCFHDDITVVVIFIDHEDLVETKASSSVPEVSIRGFVDTEGPSKFSTLY